MIDFPCTRCGRPMSVPTDMAGGDIQCPNCGLLLSIPNPSDLQNINADGTLQLSAPAPLQNADRLETMLRTLGTRRTDDDGEEIDNRSLPETIELAPMPEPPRSKPRYDPETGELVTALEILPPIAAPAPPPPSAEAAAAALVGYRPKGASILEPKRVAPRQVAMELFQPLNIFVMGAVLLAHVVLSMGLAIVNAGMVFVVILPLIMFMLILGQYGNVIDEIGPTDLDELPRPLRTVSWGDDIWGPFRDVFASLAVAGAPLWLYFILSIKYDLPIALSAGVGLLAAVVTVVTAYFLPALLLTFRTSGSLANLRPDRVVGVVAKCGKDYLPVVALGYATLVFYIGGIVLSFYALATWMGSLSSWPDLKFLGSAPAAYAVMITGIYLAHLFCWRVGLLYRLHQPQFPWVDQEHIREPKAAAGLSAKDKVKVITAESDLANRRKKQVVKDIERLTTGRTLR